MKQTKTTLGQALVLILMLVCVSQAWAFKNEPNGFRGFIWDSPLSEHADVLVLKTTGNNIEVFTRKHDKLKIGGAVLSKLYYGYYKDRFVDVAMEADGEHNVDALKAAFEAHFGPGATLWPSVEQPGLSVAHWQGKTTGIRLACDSDIKCIGTMVSVRVTKRIEADHNAAAQNSGSDF
jgi:hypothetical protein